jgi:riboflavin kinase / FMN adenylyltransferase
MIRLSSGGHILSDFLSYFRNHFFTMQVFRNPTSLPHFPGAVVTIGTFDGVHTGHQQVIEQLKKEAAQIGGQTVIITFDPHPRKIVNNLAPLKLINTPEEKIQLLAERGIDQVVVVPFTEAFSKMTPEQYIGEFLVEKFHPHTIIIGYDHRFGKDRKGDFHLLEELSAKYQYVLKEIPVHIQHAISVSSTRIREAISSADMEAANDLLGYTFFFEGRVVLGNKLGRTIGYPTANLKIEDDEKIIPGDGVYAVEVCRLGAEKSFVLDQEPVRYKAMMNIGMRPTVGGTDKVIEVNLFDFDSDLYGEVLRVFVRKYLRAEQVFGSLDKLKEQLSLDKMKAMRLLQ